MALGLLYSPLIRNMTKLINSQFFTHTKKPKKLNNPETKKAVIILALPFYSVSPPHVWVLHL